MSVFMGPEDMLRHGKRMWVTKYKDKYPHHATTPQDRIAPHQVPMSYGKFAAVVMERNVRTWGFEHKAARDRFVKEYGGTAI